MTFVEKLNQRIAATGSNLCVGLDPRADLIKGDVGAKAILRQHQTELTTIPVPADQLLDMDVPDDLPTPSLQSL